MKLIQIAIMIFKSSYEKLFWKSFDGKIEMKVDSAAQF